MALVDNFTITGKSGTMYPFKVYPMGQAFKALGGVYAITKRELRLGNAPLYHFVYIGETGDLSTRFDNHHKQACFDKAGADFIGVHLDGAQKSRTSTESDILAAHKWPCND